MKKIIMLIVVLIAIGCGAVAYADETGSSSSNSNNAMNQTNNNNNTTSTNQANGSITSTNSSNEVNSNNSSNNNGNSTNSNISQSNNKSIFNTGQNNNSNEDNSYHIVNAPNYVYLLENPVISPSGPYIKERIPVGSKVEILKDNKSKTFDKIEYNGEIGYVPGIFVNTYSNPQILNKVIDEENQIKQDLRNTGSYVPSQFIEPIYIPGQLGRGPSGPECPFALVNGYYINRQDPYKGYQVLQIIDSAPVNGALLGVTDYPGGHGIFAVNGKTGYSQFLQFYYDSPKYGENY